jgi:predicted Zn finger-like uncharacterized protein
MFKVVADQLRVSEGWVRCGKCEEIFNASAHMVEVEPSAPAADHGPDAAPFEGALAAAMAAAPAAQSVSPEGSVGSPREASAATLDFELKEAPPADAPSLVEPALASSRALPEGSVHDTQADDEPVTQVSESAPAVAQAEPAELSFMRKAGKKSPWHRPLVRAILMVAGLLLMTGLALQVLVQERDRIAAVEPGLKPMLGDICLLLDCKVAPLRQIESVVIDSSAFSKTKGDVYRLSLTLKNNAPIDLAMPAIELALTDSMDRTLVRRVFRPEELGLRSGVIGAASETQTTLELTIKTNGSGERVAGYRLVAFYP